MNFEAEAYTAKMPLWKTFLKKKKVPVKFVLIISSNFAS